MKRLYIKTFNKYFSCYEKNNYVSKGKSIMKHHYIELSSNYD